MLEPHAISPGEPHPLGATLTAEGVNFSLFSRSATAVELLLFERYDDPEPRVTLSLDARTHRTFNYWHVHVAGATAGLVYAYRVHGPDAPSEGHRFNPNKVLLDPYAKAIVYGDNFSHDEACTEAPNVASAMKSLVIETSNFDWDGVGHPNVPPTERIIYEVHVRGFTRDPSAGTRVPGTFDALVQKIPYLVDLGVTTVELLPVFQFDENDSALVDPTTGRRLTNFWGYNPLGFFAPHRGYYTEDWSQMRHLTGFRDMVKAMHAAGIEVFLDVVFNHTAEGDEDGPTLAFRGIENAVYYLLEPEDRRKYLNFSGTGNTVSCNHPIVRRLILDCLRYWVEVMHVDGFRFDLAAVMSRDEHGQPIPNPPLPWEIEMDPVLSRTRLIAEAWDAGGLYQVGEFPGERWFEWNGVFRDDVRRFVRGDFGYAGAVASRMLGSPDLYESHGRRSTLSVNFVTAHDGFTMYDLVSYERKHNEANGEDGRDGSNENFSANHGVEGPTDDPAVERARIQQVKNFFAVLMLSQGTPMMLGGDEMCRTQSGNNNAYCQDNTISWFDWGRLERYGEVHRFVRAMIAFRRAHPSVRRRRFVQGADAPGAGQDGSTRVRWHGTEIDRPDWSHGSRTLAFTLDHASDDDPLHIMLNMHEGALSFAVPPATEGWQWHTAVDTAAPSPNDAPEGGAATPVADRVDLAARSVVVLVQRPIPIMP
ncbi:MAG: glycogen debranching protein GlgX [Myxococcota bacterium]